MSDNQGLIRFVDPIEKIKPRANKSQNLDPDTVSTVIEAAKMYDVDPNSLLAVGLQESNLGKDLPGTLSYVHFVDDNDYSGYRNFAERVSNFSSKEVDDTANYLDNIGRNPNTGKRAYSFPNRTVGLDGWEEYLPEEDFNEYSKSLADMVRKYQFAVSSAQVADRLKEDFDKYSDSIKAYQSFNGFGKTKYYDKKKDKVRTIDQNKEFTYGKRVLQLERGIRNNKDIQKMIDKIYGN